MKAILNQLCSGECLSESQAQNILVDIAKEKYNLAQIAAFLTIFMMRPLTVEELSGFRKALLQLAVTINLSQFNTIDLCGTGGDGKNTFNISTLTAFVVAGAGYKVAKHGNYSVSSASGSSNVLEQLGYHFTSDEDILKRQLDKCNLCFLHAPLFHPAMKAVAPARKQLGMKTFFNMLGPLVNPSNPQNQLSGVFDLQVARNYHHLLQNTSLNYGVVYALDGYDEISLTGPFHLYSKKGIKVYKPEDLGFEPLLPSDIFGGSDVLQAVEIFKNIIQAKGTFQQNKVVLTNAAFAIMIMEPTTTFQKAYALAEKSLLGKKAEKALQKLISLS